MKQIKITKEEVEALRDFMFEERALSAALGRVERRKSSFWDEIVDKYSLSDGLAYSVDHKTRKISITGEKNKKKKK